MASIQQSIGGLTGSIFAATAMGSHLIQNSPEYRAGKLEQQAETIRRGTINTIAEEIGHEKSKELEEEAVKLSPSPERLIRSQESQLKDIEDKKNVNDIQKGYGQKNNENEESLRQIGHIILESGRRDLSRQQTLDYVSQIEKLQKEYASKGGNK